MRTVRLRPDVGQEIAPRPSTAQPPQGVELPPSGAHLDVKP